MDAFAHVRSTPGRCRIVLLSRMLCCGVLARVDVSAYWALEFDAEAQGVLVRAASYPAVAAGWVLVLDYVFWVY